MKYSIGELAEIIDGDRGKNYPKHNEFFEKGYCLFLNTSNVTKSGFSFNDNMFITKDKSDSLRKGKIERGDIVYTTRGTVGNVAFYDDNIEYENIRINSGMVIIRAKEEIVSNKFLYFLLKDDKYRTYLKSFCTGSAQPQLPIKNLSQIVLDIPKKEIQNKIADIISNYDNLIDNNQKQIKLLEESAQRLYKEWFVDFHFPGYETTEFENGLPKGWKKECFKNIFDYVRGKSYSSKEICDNGRMLMVNLKNIKAFGGYNRDKEKHFNGSVKSEQILSAGDIVLGVTDMTQERRLVGYVALVPKLNDKVTFSMDLLKIIPKNVGKYYLYASFLFGGYSKKISAFANGVNVLHLKPDAISDCQMTIPAKELMTNFDNILSVIYDKIDLLERQSGELSESRDRLLPKLIANKL